MMFIRNKINASLSIFIMTSLCSFGVKASVMEDIFTEAVTFQKNNATSVNTMTRNGYSFGGASYRIKNVNAPLVSFEPPRMSGGCGGIDFFAGSFSTINSDQLVQMGRAIAQGVPSYAFNLALTSVCPSCSDLMQNIQDKLDEFNKYGRDGCKQAVNFLEHIDVGGKSLKSKVESSMKWGALDDMADSASGWVKDIGEAKTTSNDTDNIAKKAAKNGIEIEGNEAKLFLSKTNISNYSHTIPGFNGSRLEELIMSLTGTSISKENGSSSDTNSGLDIEPIAPTMTIEDLFNGTEDGKLTFIKCVNPVSDPQCLNVTKSTINHRGLSEIFSDVSKSAITKLTTRGAKMNVEEDAVQALSGLKIQKVLDMLDGNERGVADMVSQKAKIAVSKELRHILVELITKLNSAGGAPAGMTAVIADGYGDKLKKLKSEINQYIDKEQDEYYASSTTLAVMSLVAKGS